jgi:hypothetical protein
MKAEIVQKAIELANLEKTPARGRMKYNAVLISFLH